MQVLKSWRLKPLCRLLVVNLYVLALQVRTKVRILFLEAKASLPTFGGESLGSCQNRQ